ncbi:uncharacterized protein UTRI_04536_B [Ustilago trichophora]|uniref:Uncharacterized protein n=1 Tax=Ustilago trichophora TaxID=86804 RepID=A0A5C3EEV4_9BASI|nr:uncharacterized protein UTRI_04536_B [Ustilago trichophora]
MTLIRPLGCAYIAALGILLLLSRCCRAPGTEIQEAGPSETAITPTLEIPEGTPITAGTYFKKYIELEKLKALKPSRNDRRFDPYREIPFYKVPSSREAPIYATTTPRRTVLQALVDKEAVYIVNPQDEGDAKLVAYNSDLNSLRSYEVENPKQIMRMYKLDPKLHVLRKHLQGLKVTFEQEKDISAVPHVHGKPILSRGDGDLSKGAHSLGHLMRASNSHEKKFYYTGSGQKAVLIDPEKEYLVEDVTPREEKEIEEVLNGYKADRIKYGNTLASIIWGQPIRLDPRHRESRIKDLSLSKYPRFFSEDVPLERDRMINTLQEHGRLRLYLKDTQGRKAAYKVKVENPEASGHEPMKLSIDPLGWRDKAAEKVQSWRGKVRIPGPTRLADLHRLEPI